MWSFWLLTCWTTQDFLQGLIMEHNVHIYAINPDLSVHYPWVSWEPSNRIHADEAQFALSDLREVDGQEYLLKIGYALAELYRPTTMWCCNIHTQMTPHAYQRASKSREEIAIATVGKLFSILHLLAGSRTTGCSTLTCATTSLLWKCK